MAFPLASFRISGVRIDKEAASKVSNSQLQKWAKRDIWNVSQVTSHSNAHSIPIDFSLDAEPWQHLEPTHSATSSASGEDTLNLIESSCRIIVLQSYSVSFSSLQRLSFEIFIHVNDSTVNPPSAIRSLSKPTSPAVPQTARLDGPTTSTSTASTAPRRAAARVRRWLGRLGRHLRVRTVGRWLQGATGDTTRDIVVYINNMHTYINTPGSSKWPRLDP